MTAFLGAATATVRAWWVPERAERPPGLAALARPERLVSASTAITAATAAMVLMLRAARCLPTVGTLMRTGLRTGTGRGTAGRTSICWYSVRPLRNRNHAAKVPPGMGLSRWIRDLPA